MSMFSLFILNNSVLLDRDNTEGLQMTNTTFIGSVFTLNRREKEVCIYR